LEIKIQAKNIIFIKKSANLGGFFNFKQKNHKNKGLNRVFQAFKIRNFFRVFVNLR